MGKGLHDLELKDEPIPAQTYDDLPEFGSFTPPPPQPGKYRFKLAADLTRVFDTFDDKQGKQQLQVVFDKDAPLTIVQSPGNKVNGDTFTTRLSTLTRKRGEVEASDLDFLLKALGEKARPSTLKGYAEALMRNRGKEFAADIAWSWYCNDQRHIWSMNAEGKRVEVENQNGCSTRFYQADKTKKDEQKIARQEDGTYPLEIACRCGAVVRAFANLDNITELNKL